MARVLPDVVRRTYRASAVGGPPRLAGLPEVSVNPPEETVLDAFHLDTADLRLAAAGIAVSRLFVPDPGGEANGWLLETSGHPPLDVPAHPTDAGRLPSAIRSMVRPQTRGRELVAKAHSRTTRWTWELTDLDGTAIGRVSSDEVSAQAVIQNSTGTTVTVESWSEFTVVIDADRSDELWAAIESRLDEVGAHRVEPEHLMDRLFGPIEVPADTSPPPRKLKPKSPAGEVLLAHLAEQAGAIAALDPQVRRSEDGALHQMHVATRRLRAALRTFGAIVDRRQTSEFVDELTWLAGGLGAARDREVVEGRLRAHLTTTGDGLVLGPIARRLDEQFAADRAQAQEWALEALGSDRYDALLGSLDGLLIAPPLTAAADKAARAVLPKLVRKAAQALDGALDVVANAPTDAAVADARAKAMAARYAAETVRRPFGAEAAESAARYLVLQTLLGEYQDTVATRAHLRQLGARGHLAGQNGFSYGLWYAREEQAAERIRQELPAVAKRARSAKHRRWMG